MRAFAAHLGVAVASVTNWEQRGERIRLRHETQEILDSDFKRASDDVRTRFQAMLSSVSAKSMSDDARRLEHVLAYPNGADLVTAKYLREQVAELDAEYDHAPSASLLGAAGQRHGQIRFLVTRASDSRVQAELVAASAESAILMGQLVWDVSLRKEHAAALYYFDAAAQAADLCGDRVAACRAQLRRSYVALYGQHNPAAGLEMAAQAAYTGSGASNVLAGLALLHVAEAQAMCGAKQSCEKALSSAETHFGKIDAADEAAPMFTPIDLSRMAGSCYLHLEDAPKAADFLTDTLNKAGQTKAAAVAAANLALAYARQDQVDEAVGSLHRAIDIIDTTRGGGGLNVAFTAGRALNSWRDNTAVQRVHDRLFTLMAA